MKNISTSYSQQYNKKVSLLSQQTGKKKKKKPKYKKKKMKHIVLFVYHYSSKLNTWSWQKLWGDRVKGLGYKK